MLFLNIFGGLAVFLFAMRQLSTSLQNVIGERIEYVLRKLTNRLYKGMIVGSLVTFLTQSSSITVLTLIGLVNVGVLSFKQGLGILLGAEIGTTITAQLVTIKIGTLYFPILILGLLLTRFSKKNLEAFGKVIFSFGLLFMGMEMMKAGALPLRDLPSAVALLKTLGTMPVLGIIAGAIFTAITSSSSATTSLVVALGVSGSITLPAAIALIMGANIGTTFLELVAVTGMSLTAKRIAAAQALINVLGVVLMYPILVPFASLVAMTSGDLSHQIANSHTIFNVGSSIVFLMFAGTISTVSKKIVPGKIVRLKRGTKYLDPHILNMPHIAVVNVTKEIKRMGGVVLKMFDYIGRILEDERDDLIDTVYKCEDFVDSLNLEISKYLSLLSEHELSTETTQRIAQLLHGVSDIERTADHLNKITENLEILIKRNNSPQPKFVKKLNGFTKNCANAFKFALKCFVDNDTKNAGKVPDIVNKIQAEKKTLEVALKKSNLKQKKLVLKIVHHLERAAHHGENLSDIVTSGF